MPSYDRFWDIHLTANNGWYDWADAIQTNGQYQMSHNALSGGTLKVLISPLATPGIVQPLAIGTSTPLPNTGVVASLVKVQDLQGATVDADTQSLVTWINDAQHKGKLRLNAHGDVGGAIGMGTAAQGTSSRTMNGTLAGYLVGWLQANGLQGGSNAISKERLSEWVGWTPKKKTGLLTINLAICESGIASTVTTNPSGVQQVVTALNNAAIYGIEVTGSKVGTQMSPRTEILRSSVLPPIIHTITTRVEPHLSSNFDAALWAIDAINSLKPHQKAMLVQTRQDNNERLLSPLNDYNAWENWNRTDLVLLVAECMMLTGAGTPGQWGRKVGSAFEKLAKSKNKVSASSSWTPW